MNFGLQTVSVSPVDCGFIQTQAGCILVNLLTPDIKTMQNADPSAFEEMQHFILYN